MSKKIKIAKKSKKPRRSVNLPTIDGAVRVVVRLRPQSDKEIGEKALVQTSVDPSSTQVTLSAGKSFTFDHVFGQSSTQEAIYERFVKDLVQGTFNGFNATVLAYGQTGSGKTYTMGTSVATSEKDRGLIARAADHLFAEIQERKTTARAIHRPEPTFIVLAQFIELYNEELIDLLAVERQGILKISEDPNTGEIYIRGVTSVTVNSAQQILDVLKKGSLNRTTAATKMNETSSRSHAIFTIGIKQQREVPVEVSREEDIMNATLNGLPVLDTELEVLTAKFHFVDLAGSERLKRTGATGDRAKEGISINCGLLALGNVISALSSNTSGRQHIPYRDSKLTRLLQDSLGGNSRTLMIACASPSDVDSAETFSTLQYANRAKNIRNKVTANQDKTSNLIAEQRAEIAQLKAQVARLQAENASNRPGMHSKSTSKVVSAAASEGKESDSEKSVAEVYCKKCRAPVEVSDDELLLDGEAAFIDGTNYGDLLHDDLQLDDDDDENDDEEHGGEISGDGETLNELRVLESNIEEKETLMRELKRKENQAIQIRQEYERKMLELSARIEAMEQERDRILKDSRDQEKILQVKAEYEKRIGSLRNDLRKLKNVEKEHVRMQAQQQRQQEELRACLDQIKEMKRNKVELMNRLKDEGKRTREMNTANTKQVSQLEKQLRQRDNLVRKLRDQLKCRTDECARLRQQKEKQTPAVRPPMKGFSRNDAFIAQTPADIPAVPILTPGTRRTEFYTKQQAQVDKSSIFKQADAQTHPHVNKSVHFQSGQK